MTPHVTQLLSAIEQGDPTAADQLLPLIYDDLRKIAALKLARERPGQTLQATALVHEAWLRLGGGQESSWENRRHFFAAVAEAMRRILVERARRRQSLRYGGGVEHVPFDDLELPADLRDDQLVHLDEALNRLAAKDPVCAELIKLRFFAGIPNREAAAILGLSERTAKRDWAYARAWLAHELK